MNIIGNEQAEAYKQAAAHLAELEENARMSEMAADADWKRKGWTDATKRAYKFAAEARRKAGQQAAEVSKMKAENLEFFAKI